MNTCQAVVYKSKKDDTEDTDQGIRQKRQSKLLPLLPEDTCNIKNFEIVRDEEDDFGYDFSHDYKPKTKEQYERYRKFIELNPVCKRIILEMYESFEDYIISEKIHPLEEIVFLLYKFWDSESTIRAIASRVGIYIGFDENYTASEILLDKLISILEKNTDSQTIAKIIDMTESQFRKLVPKVTQEDFEIAYQNRLVFLLHA